MESIGKQKDETCDLDKCWIMTLVEAIRAVFSRKGDVLHMQDLYARLPDRLPHSIRAQVYKNLGKRFRRVGRGLYAAIEGDAACVVVRGDALEEVRKLATGSVDCLLTDPPYDWQDGANNAGTNPKMELPFERSEVDATLGLELWRALREGAHAFFFVPAETAATRPGIERFIRTLESCGFRFNKRLIWYKKRMGMGYNGRCVHEAILFMSKGARRMPRDLRVKDVIEEPPVHPSRKRHPAEKPAGLLEKLIRFATSVGETVLDCYAGSLSTGRAALRLGRNAILIEKDRDILRLGLAEAK